MNILPTFAGGWRLDLISTVAITPSTALKVDYSWTEICGHGTTALLQASALQS